jgi:hypothetical protein
MARLPQPCGLQLALTMRNRIFIPQSKIDAAGFVGRVNIEGWILLDYLRHWPACKNLRRRQWNGYDFFWLDYHTACQDLPLLFPRRPKPTTQINKLTLLIARLRRGGLIDTRRLGPRCYIRLTSIALSLYAIRDQTLETDIDMPSQDIQITETCDTDVSSLRDSQHPLHIIEEQLEKEPLSHKPHAPDSIHELSESIAKIFGRTYLEPYELKKLRGQLPIPAGELTLVSRFYELRAHYQDFTLNRRRKSPSTLIDHWAEVVDQAAYYFKAHPYKWDEQWGSIPQVRFLAS